MVDALGRWEPLVQEMGIFGDILLGTQLVELLAELLVGGLELD